MACTWLVALVAACSLFATPAPGQAPQPSSQAAPPRDAPGTAAGTGVLRGRVTAAASGHPLHRVKITLNGSAPNLPSTVTDTRGVFELTSVS